MNSVSLGVYNNLRLYLIVSKYNNRNLALILIKDNNTEFITISSFIKSNIKLNNNEIILNPKVPKTLKEFLIRKGIIKKTVRSFEYYNYLLEIVEISISKLKYYDPNGFNVVFKE